MANATASPPNHGKRNGKPDEIRYSVPDSLSGCAESPSARPLLTVDWEAHRRERAQAIGKPPAAQDDANAKALELGLKRAASWDLQAAAPAADKQAAELRRAAAVGLDDALMGRPARWTADAGPWAAAYAEGYAKGSEGI